MKSSDGHPVVLVLHGPSGVGKDTIVEKLQEKAGIHRPTSSTDRKPRDGEVAGVDYHFLSTEEFKAKIAAGDFIEHADVYGDLKGLERSELEYALDHGRDVIIRTDVQGARRWREMLPDVITILLVASHEHEPANYRTRLEQRETEDAESFTRRAADLTEDLADSEQNDYVVVNSDGALDAAVDEIIGIIKKERLSGHPLVRLPS